MFCCNIDEIFFLFLSIAVTTLLPETSASSLSKGVVVLALVPSMNSAKDKPNRGQNPSVIMCLVLRIGDPPYCAFLFALSFVLRLLFLRSHVASRLLSSFESSVYHAP
jgi:hypothetical protein